MSRLALDYSTDPLSTGPNSHDYAQLATIHGHLDSTSTVGTATASGAAASVGEERSSWGREVERPADGSHSVFRRGFTGSGSVITHVTWAR